MKLHELSPAPGSTKKAYRVGRGAGSGNGKTAGKGHKGQKARSGGGVRPGFEGGQMPLQRRIPKRGFNNIFAKQFAIVNVSDLEKFDNDTVVTEELLVQTGLVKKALDGVKVLGNGELSKKLTVNVTAFSASAKEKIEKAEADVIAAKKKYDQATANLKELLDKRDAIRKEEILSAVVKSGRSYEEIMNFLNAGSDGEKTEK